MKSKKQVIIKVLKEESDWIFIIITILLFFYISRNYQPEVIEPTKQELIDTLEE